MGQSLHLIEELSRKKHRIRLSATVLECLQYIEYVEIYSTNMGNVGLITMSEEDEVIPRIKAYIQKYENVGKDVEDLKQLLEVVQEDFDGVEHAKIKVLSYEVW